MSSLPSPPHANGLQSTSQTTLLAFRAQVTPLLEDALMDRDLVHRQTAASVVQHMSMGVAGELSSFFHHRHSCAAGPCDSCRLTNPSASSRHSFAGQSSPRPLAGLGCEDALLHLLNHVWPNIFETSPHVVQAVTGAINGCRLALGPAVILGYVLQVRFQSKPFALCCRE